MIRASMLVHTAHLERQGLNLDELLKRLSEQGIAATAEALTKDIQEAELAQRLKIVQPELLIAAGGDGTMHLAANLAWSLGLPLGILPLGTANDFARSLGLTDGLEQALIVLGANQRRQIDLGRMNQRVFLNAGHLGLGVETARRTRPELKRLIGPLAYLVAGAESLSHMEPLAIAFEWPGQGLVKLFANHVLIGNGIQYGGGARISAEASFEDGLLDVYLVEQRLKGQDLLKLIEANQQKAEEVHSGVWYTRLPRFDATLWKPAAINLDGEIYPETEQIQVESLPAALEVIAPAIAPVV